MFDLPAACGKEYQKVGGARGREDRRALKRNSFSTVLSKVSYSCNDNKVSSLVDSIGANGLVSFAMDFSLHRRSGPGTYLHLLQIMHRTESLGSKGLGVACATGRRWLTLVQGHTGKQTAWETLFLLEMPGPLILCFIQIFACLLPSQI